MSEFRKNLGRAISSSVAPTITASAAYLLPASSPLSLEMGPLPPLPIKQHAHRQPIRFDLAAGIALLGGNIFVVDSNKILALTPHED